MDSTVIVGLIAGIFGAIAAGVPAYLAQRNAPSKKVFDTASIVDSTGKVVTMYRTEIDRLDAELIETRLLLKTLTEQLNKRITDLLQTIGDLKAVIAKLETIANTPPVRAELIATVSQLHQEIENLQSTIRELRK